MAKHVGQSVHKSLSSALEEEEKKRSEIMSVDGLREQLFEGFLR